MSSSLHNHSEFSFLDGFSHPKDYLDKAKELGLKAFAITEHGNQCSWVYFDMLKKDYPDIKMIYGVELYEAFDINIRDKNSKYFHLVALAKNEKGRIALNNLVTKSNFEGFYFKPRVDLEMMKPYANDLVVSSACLASKLSREEDYQKCIEYIDEYKSIFPYFYLEMQSHNTDDQEEYNKKILQLSKDTNTPFIITTDSHVADKNDLYYQARHVQIAHDSETMSEAYSGCYMQSDEEIHCIMDKQIGYDNVCIGLRNTDLIADMIDEVNMPFQEPQLPTFPLPEGFKSNNEYIWHLLKEGWKTRRFNELTDEDKVVYKERMEYEMRVIHNMKYDGYFLIVWDFINFCRKNGYPVGAGRGSGSGSLVCFLLGITNLNPMKYGLIFERFLNEERISLPDIDTDVSNRKEVVKYLEDKYGKDNVCQIINFSYITPVVAIKDVAKVLDIPYKLAEKISKYFSYETFQECIDKTPNIYEMFLSQDEELNNKLKDLFDIASKISGRVRHTSVHAGGIGIVDTSINDYMGMKVGSKGERVIQVDKKVIENIGIIKFDLLGVATLNIVAEGIKDTGISEWELDINNPEFENDQASYDLLCSGKTDGVFQVASFEMKALLQRLQPRNIGHLADLIALFRPDSMEYIEPYIARKNFGEPVDYIHPDMEKVLGETYGCMIYQEQLMEITRVFGGRTYGGADLFRKGIGKKDKALVRKEASKLKDEIIENGYDKEIAEKISDNLAKKGSYSFNKSHAVSYAVLTLQTAYLKAHYPVVFYKALLNMVLNDTGKVNKIIVDAQDFGVKILPPHINKSGMNFTIDKDGVRFGLKAIRGIGENLAEEIIKERETNGKFTSLDNLLSRVKLSDAQVVILIKSGAIPCKDKRKAIIDYGKLGYNKKEYRPVKTLPSLLKLREQYDIDTDVITSKEERLEIYNKIRKEMFDKNQITMYNKYKEDFSNKYLQDENMWEFQALSIFLNNNPFAKAYEYIRDFDKVENGDSCVVVGVVSKITKKKDKNKNQYAFVVMYTADGVLELTCWSSQYAEYQNMLVKDSKLAILCNKKDDKAFISKVKPYNQWLNDVKREGELLNGE